MKPSPNKKKILFPIFAIALFASSSFAQNNTFGLIDVENKTTSLTVVSVEDKGPIKEAKERGFGDLSQYRIVLRNDYNKPVAVYKLEGWDGTTSEKTNQSPEGTFLTKWTFKPGQTMTTNLVASTGNKARLIVEAVIFEDGAGDGDPAVVEQLQEQRKGAGLAYQKLIPVLKEALKNPGSLTTPAQIGELEEKIENIWPDKNEPDAVKRGFDRAKGLLCLFLHATGYFMNSGYGPEKRETIPERLAEMEAGLKRYLETASPEVAAAGSHRNK